VLTVAAIAACQTLGSAIEQEEYEIPPFARMPPVRKVLHRVSSSLVTMMDDSLRGGASENLIDTIAKLGDKFGSDFLDAIEQNTRDHESDCRLSCKHYYCAPSDAVLPPLDQILNGTSIESYSMGPVPPEDFASDFGFPLDLIKVTKPLFSPCEAANVIRTAEAEGVDKNEYVSGKYKLGGDWLTNLPKTREWFNKRLETTFFPLLSHLFPEVISSPSIIRAHSVSLLKYNSSHPRTDVHIDNGILSMTLAMTPQDEYTGGGTFFEHLDEVLPMDVGKGTFRPGSVRHGGHRVTNGTRYILGAFLLLQDRVEHVRRLKNRGSELRRKGDMVGAARHFEWALAINPRCVSCLKDSAEILLASKDYVGAEKKIREALALLENKDSDALFTLGLLLSEQGRDDESIAAYQKSVALNAEDVELCYNLGIKLGAKGKTKEEMEMYARATQVDPKYGGAWLNWGTALAEAGNMDDVSIGNKYAIFSCTNMLSCYSNDESH
jgi:tetratricopeptide (TPR) repeat protein